MSVHKVPQDVEAEDKLIGPLTFRKAAFAGIAAAALATAYFMGRIPPKPFWAIVPLPIVFCFALLAFFPSKDQPVEVILAAKIRFMFKPHKRIWDQRGMKQLVTITVPRREHKQLTKGYSENEVSSRLTALAKTLDSRGWAVKNVNLNTFSQPAYASGPSDQRLISPSILPQATQSGVDVRRVDIKPADDILDHTSNPIAQHFDTMMNRAAESQRRTAIDRMHQAAQEPPTYAIPEPPAMQRPGATRHAVGNPDGAGYATFGATTLQAPSDTTVQAITPPSADEEEFLARVRHEQSGTFHPSSNMKRIKTPKEIEEEAWELQRRAIESEKKQEAAKAAEAERQAREAREQAENRQAEPSPDTANPAILELANNDDLNIATLARQAKVESDKKDDGEVVISLR